LYTIFSAEVKIADFANGVDVGKFLHQTGISSVLRAKRSWEVVKQSKCLPPLQTNSGVQQETWTLVIREKLSCNGFSKQISGGDKP